MIGLPEFMKIKKVHDRGLVSFDLDNYIFLSLLESTENSRFKVRVRSDDSGK